MQKDPNQRPYPEKFYGRRAGQTLREQQAARVRNMLPTLRVPDEQSALSNLPSLFDFQVSDIWLEIGFGGGEHLAWQAQHNPSVGFIGAEPYINGVAKLLAQIEQYNLSNIRIVDNDIRPYLDQMGDETIARAFLLFPDPWPKARHHKRRFVNHDNLDRLQRIMKPGSIFRVASDIDDYIEWSLHEVAQHGGFRWTKDKIEDCTQRPDDWPQTRYEAKAERQGRTSTYLEFQHL